MVEDRGLEVSPVTDSSSMYRSSVLLFSRSRVMCLAETLAKIVEQLSSFHRVSSEAHGIFGWTVSKASNSWHKKSFKRVTVTSAARDEAMASWANLQNIGIAFTPIKTFSRFPTPPLSQDDA